MKIVQLNGGLGNQMFQYAFALSLKNKFQHEKILIDPNIYMLSKIHTGFEINKLFNLEIKNSSIIQQIRLFYPFWNYKSFKFVKDYLPLRNKVLFETQDGCYDKSYKEIAGSAYYIGFWQSEKYFFEIRENLLETFKFPPEKNTKNLSLKEKIFGKNYVSIHIRRGDYLNYINTQDICHINYYKESIEIIMKLINPDGFIIFSDDINWCKQKIIPLLCNNNYILVDWNQNQNSFRDMELMSYCKHNIIANSTFSWWGAWLNKNKKKIVIAPKKWMQNGEWKDIIPDTWIKI